MTAEASYSILLAGGSGEDTTVLFEPCAGEFVLKPGGTLKIDISGPENERLEVTHGPGYVVLWPSPALSVTVFNTAGERIRLIGY